MDFSTVLTKAQKNGDNGKPEIRYYSTKYEPPKKVQRNKPNSANIQKFLARKEEEEKIKAQASRKERDQLLELRSKDKKATRRVTVMLKRTKSASQSVMNEAGDNDNTAVTLAGANSQPQPDEDDYGYVSQSAAEYYKKMMEKYSKMPDEPRFKLGKKKVSSNLSNTKDRVRAALEKEKEEAAQPHRRRRKHKEDGEGSKSKDEEYEEEKYEKKKEEKTSKPKFKAAPVVNFNDLLKLAEKKQFEPIKIEKKEQEDSRLFTKRQRREYEVQREIRESKERRERERENPILLNKLIEAKPKMTGMSDRIPKTNGSTQKPGSSNQSNQITTSANKGGSSNTKNQSQPLKRPDDRNKPSLSSNKPPTNTKQDPQTNKPKQFPPKQNPRNNERPKQFPPNDLMRSKTNSKQFPPSDVRKNNNTGIRLKPGANKRVIYDDDDEDYDSEMDDFIDDAPDAENDYSKYISEIFGYDKRKWRDVDEDDDNMETSFAAQMKEEVISTKIGIREDLEELKMEEAHQKKKAMMKKQKR